MTIIAITRDQLVIDAKVRNLCRVPWRGHPHGCPNWGVKPGCPPSAPNVRRVLDLDRPMWLVVNEYDLGAHVERARAKHPDWTERALRNPRHWQGTARKAMWAMVDDFIDSRELWDDVVCLGCPEGSNVDVTATYRAVTGEELWAEGDWESWVGPVRQIALIGYPSEAWLAEEAAAVR